MLLRGFGAQQIYVLCPSSILVRQQHLQAVAVEQGGKTGWELRQIVQRRLVRERDDMRRYFYVTGLGLLDQLRSIQLAGPLDLEGAAMANPIPPTGIYCSMKRMRRWLPTGVHTKSFPMRAGSQTNWRIFATPSVLPVHDFHSSLAAASIFGQG